MKNTNLRKVLATAIYSLALFASANATAAALTCAADTCSAVNGAVTKSISKVSEGIRIKKIAFIKVKVYKAQLYTAGGTWKKGEDSLLEKIDGNLPMVLRLHLMRDIDGAKIEDSFREALKANGVDANGPGIADLMKTILATKEIKENETVSFLAFKKSADVEAIVIVGPDGKEVEATASAGFIKNFFSIWFGKPADDQLAQLKKELLGL